MKPTLDQAYRAGYTQAIEDLIDRRAVSWKYKDRHQIDEMIRLAGETWFKVWIEEFNDDK